MAEVHTPEGSSAKDNALMAVAVFALLAGIVAFYWYEEEPLPIRLLMVAGGLAAAVGLAWFTWYGREFRQFAQAARTELRKVVWPEREDTFRTTFVVIVFAVIMGVFFWVLDFILTWLIRLLTGQPPA